MQGRQSVMVKGKTGEEMAFVMGTRSRIPVPVGPSFCTSGPGIVHLLCSLLRNSSTKYLSFWWKQKVRPQAVASGSLYSGSTHPAFTCLSISNYYHTPSSLALRSSFILLSQLLSQHKHLVPWSLEFHDPVGKPSFHMWQIFQTFGNPCGSWYCSTCVVARMVTQGTSAGGWWSREDVFLRRALWGRERARNWAERDAGQRSTLCKKDNVTKEFCKGGCVCVCMYVWVYYAHSSSIIADWFRLPTGLLPSAHADNWKFVLLSLKTTGQQWGNAPSMLFRLSLGFLEFPNKNMYLSPGSEEGREGSLCCIHPWEGTCFLLLHMQ